MTTLGIMEDRIADELARNDLSSQIRDAIRSAVNHYAGERWWFNEVQSFAITLTSSVEFYSLPSDFEHLDAYSILIGGNLLDLDQQHYDTINIWQTSQVFGQPTDFAIYGSQVDLYPIPNTSLDTVLSYVQSASTLTTTTCTNGFMTYGEELIRSRARSDIQINFLRDGDMNAEYMMLLQTGQPFYSSRERIAYTSLRSRSGKRILTNRIRSAGW